MDAAKDCFLVALVLLAVFIVVYGSSEEVVCLY